MYTTDTHLRSTTNSNICQSTLPTAAIAVPRLLHFLERDLQIFFHKKKREKEKEYHRSFLKATKRERKSGPALPNRAEPRCLPTMVARSTCIMLAEKQEKKKIEKNNCVQGGRVFPGNWKYPVDGKRIEHYVVLLVYYSTDYANNPAVSWIISFEIILGNAALEMPGKIFDAICSLELQ